MRTEPMGWLGTHKNLMFVQIYDSVICKCVGQVHRKEYKIMENKAETLFPYNLIPTSVLGTKAKPY